MVSATGLSISLFGCIYVPDSTYPVLSHDAQHLLIRQSPPTLLLLYPLPFLRAAIFNIPFAFAALLLVFRSAPLGTSPSSPPKHFVHYNSRRLTSPTLFTNIHSSLDLHLDYWHHHTLFLC